MSSRFVVGAVEVTSLKTHDPVRGPVFLELEAESTKVHQLTVRLRGVGETIELHLIGDELQRFLELVVDVERLRRRAR